MHHRKVSWTLNKADISPVSKEGNFNDKTNLGPVNIQPSKIIDNDGTICALLTDLSKAFDCITVKI